jgi:hypothetical protein
MILSLHVLLLIASYYICQHFITPDAVVVCLSVAQFCHWKLHQEPTSSKSFVIIPSKGENRKQSPLVWPNVLTSIWFLLSEACKLLLGVNKNACHLFKLKDIHSLYNKE